MTEQRTRILEQWEAVPEDSTQSSPSKILDQLDEAELQALDASEAAALPELAEGLVVRPGSPWPRRFWRLLLLLIVAGVGTEWLQLVFAAWDWQPLAGAAVAAAGGGLGVTAVLAWRDLRRQRLRISGLEQLRNEMQQALQGRDQRLAVDWLERLQGLHRGSGLESSLNAACSGLDGSHTAQEVCQRLNQQFYQPLDTRARQLVRRESASTGLLVATSPWVSLDLLLVVWRNLRMMQKVAQGYGLPVGQLSRWRLAQQVLRNIALAGGTELAIGALSDSLLSGMFEKIAARVGQGMGVGLYSARLGHFTLDLCRAVPLPSREGLAEDNRGVLQAMRERLAGGDRDTL
ncbi:MAG: TIGR01620 family protein [Halopseudomonas yangmingensis]